MLEDRLSIASAVLMVISVVISLIHLDYMWAIISAVGLVAMAIPRLAKGKWVAYHRTLVTISLIPFLLYIIVYAVNVTVGIGDYRYYSLIIQPLASMICAYMLFVSVSANTETFLSKRWLFVFSIAFTCAFAVLYLFFLFYAMKEMGFPMYNADFEGLGAPSNLAANHYIMLPINLAIVCSLVYGLLIDFSLKKVEAKDLNHYYGGKAQ